MQSRATRVRCTWPGGCRGKLRSEWGSLPGRQIIIHSRPRRRPTMISPTVLVPYSAPSPSMTSAHSSHSSRQHSPTSFASGQRRSSIGGLLSLTHQQHHPPPPQLRSPTTSILTRRRTIFGDPGWGVRVGICPEELVEALDSFADCESLARLCLCLPIGAQHTHRVSGPQ